MARQARIEYPGAIHHVRSRGNGCQDIFLDDVDRQHFLDLLGEAVDHYDWLVTAYTQMDNHFHLELETPEPNLSDGMKWLLGSYVSWFNRRHKRTGHLFGDRFHSDLIERDTYLTVVARYIALNPVAAGMVKRPEDWKWSSYRATAGLEPTPKWLAVHKLEPFFGEPSSWRSNYRDYVEEKIDSKERLWDKIENQIYLGSEEWIKEVRGIVESKPRHDDYPRAQRHVGRPAMAAIIAAVGKVLEVSEEWIRETHGNEARRIAAWLGRNEGYQRLRSIAAALRLKSSSRASDLVRQCDRLIDGDPELQRKIDMAIAAMA